MKPKIVERPAFRVVGARARFLRGQPEGVPDVWERFIPRMHEVKDVVPCVHYGVIEPARDEPEGFWYTAGAGVTSLAHVPEGMSGVEVPAATYAVFTHRGPLSGLLDTFRRMWTEWLPASGLRPTGGTEFELYDERFKMDAPDSEIDLYVPVAKPA